MRTGKDSDMLRRRQSPIEMKPEEFRKAGYMLVDRIARFLEDLPEGPVTPAKSQARIKEELNAMADLPERGEDPGELLASAADILFDHSLFNGHPRFFGYITSSAAPIGALGDLLAATVNPNVGAWVLSPVATEIEIQTIRWIAELIGYPKRCGGVLVSGGNLANFVCFLAARRARASWDVRRSGLGTEGAGLRVYASTETHTWIQKAVDLFGMGTDAIRWISVDSQLRLDLGDLRERVQKDLEEDLRPFLVVGSAGSVSTGAVDPLPGIATVCREFGLWFHVDGAYGAVAAQVEGVPPDLKGISEADSVAVDPHKWLYAPLEAGCVLVRNPEWLRDTFSYHPPYYHFGEEVTNFFDFGLQNSRGFRALKVWLGLRQVGREGYLAMIRDDIDLAEKLHSLLQGENDFEAISQSLSVTTFRYLPADLRPSRGTDEGEKYLNHLNEELLGRLEQSGELFLSKAVIEGVLALRACVVNFRTSLLDIEAVPEIVRRLGCEVDSAIRPVQLRG